MRTGVQLPVFECYSDAATSNDLTGLARGGQVIQTCKTNWHKAVELLVELASLQVHHKLSYLSPYDWLDTAAI